MQGKNSTQSVKPKAGDGTQVTGKTQDANWYGQSHEPQEEFVQDKSSSRDHHANEEGKPDFPIQPGSGVPNYK